MKYRISYNRDSKPVAIVRTADTADRAIERLCDQYGWSCRIKLVDADTRGREWATCSADPEGGINWAFEIMAEALYSV